MVLVDTSVWILHLREGDKQLSSLLKGGLVVCHPFILGELACGNLKNRTQILSLLQTLPMAIQAEHEEVIQFIGDYHVMGQGLGYIDIHLLASAILMEVPIWTLDKKLDEISAELALGFNNKEDRKSPL